MANLNDMTKSFDSKTVDKIASQIGESLESTFARPSRVRWFLMGAALGVLGAYFLDPAEGPNRRQMIGDKTRDWAGGVQRFGQESWESLQKTASNVKNRVEGNVASNSETIRH